MDNQRIKRVITLTQELRLLLKSVDIEETEFDLSAICEKLESDLQSVVSIIKTQAVFVRPTKESNFFFLNNHWDAD